MEASGQKPSGQKPRGPAADDPGARAGHLKSLVALLVKIPDGVRKFSVSADEAWHRYRLTDEDLHSIAAAGLPVRRIGDTVYYDSYDLLNVSVHLGTSPLSRMMRRFWPAALSRSAGTGATTYEIRYQPQCPAPGHDGQCSYELATPGGERTLRVVDASDTTPVLRVQVRMSANWPALPPEVCDILDAASKDLVFMWLPRPLAKDVDFMRRTRLANCVGFARMLYQESGQRGVAARMSYGLVVSPPFSIPHYWVEFRVGGVWVPADPLLVNAMIGWGVLGREYWHQNRSPGPIFARIASGWTPLAAHDGEPAAVTLPTRQIAVEPGGGALQACE